ncbi:hypothetical protein Aperf_G00000120205 [Anoplocephala perfoliata]
MPGRLRTTRSKKEPVIPSALIKPPHYVTGFLSAISFAFNFGLVESSLSISQQYSLQYHTNVLYNFINELKQRHGSESTMQTAEPTKFCSHTTPQLILISGNQEKCKILKEVSVFPNSRAESSETAIERFAKLHSEKIEVPTIDKIDRAVEYAVKFLQDRETGELFSVAVEFQPYAAYNETKGKYELSKGTYKTADEMVETYLSLLRTYPQIKVLTNPFRTEESKIWMRFRECLNSLEENPQVEIGSSTYSWELESGFRLSAAPPIPTMAKLLTSPSENIEDDDRMHPLAASDIISFDGAFEIQTDFCVLKDIAEAVIWAKEKQNKKIQFNLLQNCTVLRKENLALAVATAFGADIINFGRLDSAATQCQLAEWINTVFSDTP